MDDRGCYGVCAVRAFSEEPREARRIVEASARSSLRISGRSAVRAAAHGDLWFLVGAPGNLAGGARSELSVQLARLALVDDSGDFSLAGAKRHPQVFSSGGADRLRCGAAGNTARRRQRRLG